MSIDYNGVGGVGIYFDKTLVSKAIELGHFTEEEWEDQFTCMENLDILYAAAGNTYCDEPHFYFLVSGDDLKEVNDNKEEFLAMINSKFNVGYKEGDLKIICDIYIS